MYNAHTVSERIKKNEQDEKEKQTRIGEIDERIEYKLSLLKKDNYSFEFYTIAIVFIIMFFIILCR